MGVHWAVAGGWLAWSFYCHRTGRTQGDGRVDRWVESHRVWSAVITIALVAVIVVVARAVR